MSRTTDENEWLAELERREREGVPERKPGVRKDVRVSIAQRRAVRITRKQEKGT